MLGFSYTYLTPQEIFASLEYVEGLGLIEGMSIFLLPLCVIFLNCIAIPMIILLKKKRDIEKEKIKKKKLLTQILLQKEIEDEVEKEIQIEDEQKVVS